MDDPFGCLQGEKISSKMIKEMLQKKKKFIPIIKKNYRCPSCEEQLIYVVNEFCRACPKCGRCLILMMNSYKKKIGKEFSLQLIFI